NSATYQPSSAPLFNSEDLTVSRMYAFPPFARAYWRAIQAAVNGPLDPSVCVPVINAKSQSLFANGVNWCDSQTLTPPTAVISWFSQRRTYLQSQLATVAANFTVSPPIVSNNVVTITGSAPIGVQTIWFNGAQYPVTWTTVTNWSVRVPLQTGTNQLAVTGVDVHSQPVSGASTNIAAVYNNTLPPPIGQVVINEIMYNPQIPGADYIELFNTSTNVAFDLSSYDLHGVGYTFPPGSFISPTNTLVLASDRSTFGAAYGVSNLVFDTYTGTLQSSGETLSLQIPSTNGGTNVIVTRVKYSSAAPWPSGANGNGGSLQLIDPHQDNWRVGNWSGASLSPAATNTVQAALPSFPPLWINEIEADNVSSITNSAGQHVPWIEIYNPSSTVVSLNGLYLSTNYANLTAWAFPSTASINPGQFKIIFADSQVGLNTTNEIHTSFTLPSGAGSLALSRLDAGKAEVLDYLDYTNLPSNHSYGSFPDGQSFDRQQFFFATPAGTNNGNSGPLTVVFNELMAGNTHTLQDPADGNKYDDWFELYNYGSNLVDLTGYYLTDTLTNTTKFAIPSGYTIPPGGFLLVWADKKSTTGSSDLHVNFKLSKSGESIGLFNSLGNAVDAITFGAQTDDISLGRYPNGGANFYPMVAPTPRTNNIYNTAPVLAALSNRVVAIGQTLAFNANAIDNDLPPQTLTFTLGAGAPAGASITAAGGFQWTPTNAPATNTIFVTVTDN